MEAAAAHRGGLQGSLAGGVNSTVSAYFFLAVVVARFLLCKWRQQQRTEEGYREASQAVSTAL